MVNLSDSAAFTTALTLILLSFFWILWETASAQRFSRRKSQKIRPIRALAQAVWLFPGYSARSQVHLKNKDKKNTSLDQIKGCIVCNGKAYICAAGSRTTEWGQLLCNQETGHITGVVEHRKAPGATGGRSGDNGEWGCGWGVFVTAAHSAGASAARDINLYTGALCLVTWENTGSFNHSSDKK